MINKSLNAIFAWFQQTSSWQKLEHLADGVYLFMRVGRQETGQVLEQTFKLSGWRIYRWAVLTVFLFLLLASALFIFGYVMASGMEHGREITVAYLQEQDLLVGIAVPDVYYLHAHHNPAISENDIVRSPQWGGLLVLWILWACMRFYPPYCYWLSLRGIFLRARLFHALQDGKRR